MLPLNISAAGSSAIAIDRLLYLVHAFLGVVFVGWAIYFVYCLIRFRERPGHTARAAAPHSRLPLYFEFAILAAEIGLLAFVAAPIWGEVQNDFPEGALVVRVVAEQYAWNFIYAGPKGEVTSVNEMHVPVDRPVIVHLSSKDVVHGFNIPVLRLKRDVIPGIDTPIHFEAARVGEYDIACSQLCGLAHYRMRAAFQVESAEKFTAWLAGL